MQLLSCANKFENIFSEETFEGLIGCMSIPRMQVQFYIFG